MTDSTRSLDLSSPVMTSYEPPDVYSHDDVQASDVKPPVDIDKNATYMSENQFAKLHSSNPNPNVTTNSSETVFKQPLSLGNTDMTMPNTYNLTVQNSSPVMTNSLNTTTSSSTSQLGPGNFFSTLNQEQYNTTDTIPETVPSHLGSGNFFKNLKQGQYNNTTDTIPETIPPDGQYDVAIKNSFSDSSLESNPTVAQKSGMVTSDRNTRTSSISPRRVQTDSMEDGENESHAVIPPVMPYAAPPPYSDPQFNGTQTTVVPSGSSSLSGDPFVPDSLNFFNKPEIKLHMRKVDGIPTMTQFLDEVAKEIPTKWREFGTELGIAQDSLDTLERKHAGRDSQQCFAEIFIIWEKEREKPTSHLKACNWSSVVYILETEILSSKKLAAVIREKFLTHDEGTSGSNEMENSIGFSSNFEFDVEEQPYSLPSRLQPIENRVRVTLSPDIPTLSTKPLNTQQNVSSNRLPLSSIRPLVASNVLPSPYSPYDQAQNISSTSILPIFSTSVTNSTIVSTAQMHQPPYTNTFISPHLYQSPYSNDPRHYFPHSHTGLGSSINPYVNIPLHGRSNLSSGMYTQNMTGQLLPSAQQLMSLHQTGYPYNPPPLHPLQPDGRFPQTHDQVSLISRSGVTSLDPSHIGSHLSMGDPRYMQSFPPHVQFQNIQPQFVQQQIQTTVPTTHTVTVINPEQISLNSDEAYASLNQQRSLTTSDDVSSVSTQHNQVMSTYGSNRNVEMVHSTPVINIEKSSDASFHSATDVPPIVKRKMDESSWTELLQRYMHDLESKPIQVTPIQRRSPPPSSSPSSSPKLYRKRREEDKGLMQKELDKAYERISSLEVRVQDLTMQVTTDIPEDHEVVYFSKEKLEQDYRRMKELKKQAEKQNMEARQTTQRLVADNFRWKEDYAQLKNDREMLLNQLKRLHRKTKERESHKNEELETMNESLREAISRRYKALEGEVGIIPRAGQVLTTTDFPGILVTPQLLWKIIMQESGKLAVGHVGIAGLPSCGKTQMIHSLLKKENPGKPLKERGDDTCMQLHELLISKNPLTEETQWKLSPGMENTEHFLSTVVTQYCFRHKGQPTFPSTESIEKEVKAIPSLEDPQLQKHFIKVFKGIKAVVDERVKNNTLSELALFKPVFVNVWDCGVNRALYQFLPGIASRCKRLVMIIVIDLERDVPHLNEPPELKGMNPYKERGDDELVMQLHSRLRYLLFCAGVKHWYNRDQAFTKAPEAVIIGTHTKKFAESNGGQDLKEAVGLLQRSVIAEADKMGIANIIDPNVVTFCRNSDDNDGELNRVKATMECLISSQINFDTSFKARYMFLRSIFYPESSKSSIVPYDLISNIAFKCGVYSQNELDNFLLELRNVGSIMFYPEMRAPFLRENIVTDVIEPLKRLDTLFYFQHYNKESTLDKSGDLDQYRRGLVSKQLATTVFTDGPPEVFLEYLITCEDCAEVDLPGLGEFYFFPAIRTGFDRSFPNCTSMFIWYGCNSFVQIDSLILFVKYFSKVFKVPTEAQLEFTYEYNTLSFKYQESPSSDGVEVKVIFQKDKFEVRIPSLQSTNSTLNLSLCSRVIQLSTMVFSHISSYVQNLDFKPCIMCPESDSNDEPHFIQFFVTYRLKDVFCKVCNKNIIVKDNRSCWLFTE